MNELYKRQETINLKTPSITVIGAGGVGFHTAKFAAMSGIEKIYIFDHDIVELSNLNRLDLPMSALGVNKADAIKRVINTLRPEATVYAFPFKFKKELYRKTDWIIDCTDKADVQSIHQQVAKETNTKYLKVGYDGEHMTLSKVVAEWGEATDGYTVTPSWVVPSVIVSAMAVGIIMKHTERELSIDLKNLYNY